MTTIGELNKIMKSRLKIGHFLLMFLAAYSIHTGLLMGFITVWMFSNVTSSNIFAFLGLTLNCVLIAYVVFRFYISSKRRNNLEYCLTHIIISILLLFTYLIELFYWLEV